MSKKVLKLLTSLICLLILSASSVMAEDPVYFADANLKVAVENALGISDPTPTDMLSLNFLFADYGGISDLTGIEYASNLIELGLYYNEATDISPLSELRSLTYLNLTGNQASDISALSSLTNLNMLYLTDNQIMDITALTGLKSLTVLILSLNQINDISPLSGLTNLTVLNLGENQIGNISALSELTSLTFLRLGENQISNISPLTGLTSLETLNLNDNHISDISALSGLTNLTELRLDNNPLNIEAYCAYLRVIEENNPGIDLLMYDPNPYPPEACLADDGVSDGLFSIEGTQWQSLPIGMIIFPITDIGEIPTYEVSFHGGKVYESGIERKSFYMDMIVASIFMYTGEICNLPGDCWNYIGFSIIQPIGVGMMIVSNGIPIPSSVGAVILVKTDDNWTPPEDEPTTE